MIVGNYDQKLAVRMYKKDEPGFRNAVDARLFLGSEWQTLVSKGVSTCS